MLKQHVSGLHSTYFRNTNILVQIQHIDLNEYHRKKYKQLLLKAFGIENSNNNRHQLTRTPTHMTKMGDNCMFMMSTKITLKQLNPRRKQTQTFILSVRHLNRRFGIVNAPLEFHRFVQPVSLECITYSVFYFLPFFCQRRTIKCEAIAAHSDKFQCGKLHQIVIWLKISRWECCLLSLKRVTSALHMQTAIRHFCHE